MSKLNLLFPGLLAAIRLKLVTVAIVKPSTVYNIRDLIFSAIIDGLDDYLEDLIENGFDIDENEVKLMRETDLTTANVENRKV